MSRSPARTLRPPAILLGALALLAACGEAPTAPPGGALTLPDVPGLAASRGNEPNAKACQKNGWQGLVTSDGATFDSEETCVAYGAHGGVLYQAQTITFAPLPDRTYGDAPFEVGATASSGLAVTFAASGSCTVSGGTVTLAGAGSCTITASQAGDADWFAAPDVARTFAIAKAQQTVAFSSAIPSAAFIGSTYTPTATATSGLPVAITLDVGSTGCSLSSGVVSFTAVGTCLVNADQAGNSDYDAAAGVQQAITTRIACIDGEATLRAAAAAGGSYPFCAAGTTVLLTAGEVTVGTTLSLTNPAGANSVVDAQGASRVLHVTGGGNVTLGNVTLKGGFAAQGGGALVAAGGVLRLDGNGSIAGNSASVGAGVLLMSGSQLTLNDAASVVNNIARRIDSFGTGGGGVYLQQATLVMNGTSTVASNTVADVGSGGGGVLVNVGTVRMNDASSIRTNLAAGALRGGGVYFVNGGLLALTGTARISENAAGDGGGIYRIDGGFGTITGVTAANVVNNTPNNCAGGFAPAVPGCSN